MLRADKCNGCGNHLLIVNRKYMMCNVCNGKRLHGEGNSKQSPLKRSPLKAKKSLNKISKRQKSKNVELKEAYDLMSETREHKCTGCGSRYNLSHSHIIPRSRRPDLVSDSNNITYHCLTKNGEPGCHDIWEHGTLEEKKNLWDYEELMSYIMEVDQEWYFLLHK